MNQNFNLNNNVNMKALSLNSDDDNNSVGLNKDSDGSVCGGEKYYDYRQNRIKSYDPTLFDKIP